MAPTNVAQRVDVCEQELAGLKETLHQELDGMRLSLRADVAEQVRVGAENSMRVMREEFAGLSLQLVEEQARLQEEMRAFLTQEGQRNTPFGQRNTPPEIPRGNLQPPPGFEGANLGENRFGVDGGRRDGGGRNWRYRKLDMPLFDGNHPDGWVLRVERYFSFYELVEEEKIEAAVVSLEGDALLWYQWEDRRRPIRRWEEMKAMVLRQFRPALAGSLHEQWLAVEQKRTVIEYRRNFIEMAAPLENVPEALALGHFLNGLKPNIRAEVRLLGPRNLDHAMDLAIMAEDKLRVGQSNEKGRGGPPFPKSQPNNYFPTTSTKPISSYSSPNTTTTNPP